MTGNRISGVRQGEGSVWGLFGETPMTLIRKLIATWPAAAALCAVIAVALAVSVSAAGSHRSQQNKTSAQPPVASVESLTPEAATPSASCTAARQAVTTALANEKKEDASEKTASKSASPVNTDPAEDKTENAAMKPLTNAVRAACAGQLAVPPSAACLAARQAYTTALAPDKTEDPKEKTSSTEKSTADQAEDKTEAAALTAKKTAVRTACGTATK
jgi:type IV secretory pathway VirB10-like protein